MAPVIWLVLAAAVVAGAHPLAVAVLALALVSPGLFLVGVGGWATVSAVKRVTGRTQLAAAEARFLAGLAAEVEAGASIRQAMVESAATAPELPLEPAVRLSAAGSPVGRIASELAEALPVNGRFAAAAFDCVTMTGAAAAPTFRSLALRASDVVDLERERRVGTAQVRLTAWLIGGGPLLLLAGLVVMGRAPHWDGIVGMVAVAGTGMIVLGAGAVLLLLGRRAW